MVVFGPSYDTIEVPGAWVATCSMSASASAVPAAPAVPPPSTAKVETGSCRPKHVSYGIDVRRDVLAQLVDGHLPTCPGLAGSGEAADAVSGTHLIRGVCTASGG